MKARMHSKQMALQLITEDSLVWEYIGVGGSDPAKASVIDCMEAIHKMGIKDYKHTFPTDTMQNAFLAHKVFVRELLRYVIIELADRPELGNISNRAGDLLGLQNYKTLFE